MSDASGFTKLVPGFDFLQNLVKNAGSALPGIGQWVAPTLDPAELEKRISELRTVQFWLEQNARMLATTIQALEVQRMTLSTLKTMNVQMGDLRESLKLKTPGEDAGRGGQIPLRRPAKARAGKAKAPAGVVDPMQWWGALTEPVHAAGDDGHEGHGRRCRQEPRRQHAQAVDGQRRRHVQERGRRAGQGRRCDGRGCGRRRGQGAEPAESRGQKTPRRQGLKTRAEARKRATA